jgi:hypothetical protein
MAALTASLAAASFGGDEDVQRSFQRAPSGYSSGEETDDDWEPVPSDADEDEEKEVARPPPAAGASKLRLRRSAGGAFTVWRSAHDRDGGGVRAGAQARVGGGEALKAAPPFVRDVAQSAAGQRCLRECAAAAETARRTGLRTSVIIDGTQRDATALLLLVQLQEFDAAAAM